MTFGGETLKWQVVSSATVGAYETDTTALHNEDAAECGALRSLMPFLSKLPGVPTVALAGVESMVVLEPWGMSSLSVSPTCHEVS